MRIFLLTSSLEAGGAERVATTLCNFWAARGDEVSLIATYSGGGKPFYEVSSAVELVYLATAAKASANKLWGYGKRLKYLRKLIATRKPDVIISFLPNVNVAAVLARGLLSVPLIICERSDPSSRPVSPFWHHACRFTYRFADMLTVQTAAVAQKVADVYPGVRTIRSIPNPVPAQLGKLIRAPQGDRKKLLSLGRLSAEKQVDRVISAFASVCEDHPEWDLHVYGDGPQSDALSQLVESSGLRGRVFLKGRTDRPWDVMASSDAFVMTSLYEGFPNALLEAMAIGLPCVAFDCPSGPREITANGEKALLVPLNDQEGLVRSIGMLMSNPELREHFSCAAREYVNHQFGLEVVTQRWDQLFLEARAIS